MKKVLLVVVMFFLFAGIVSASSINGDYKGNPIVRVYVDGKEVVSEVPAHISDGSTLLPLRAVAESLGASVYWDPETYSVHIARNGEAVNTPTSPTPQPTQTPTFQGELHLYSNDGKVYLGKLTSNEFDKDSIFNQFGDYGSKFSDTSIWNEFGKYGSKFSNESAFNEFATKPPIIVTSDGKIVGYLTVNTTLSNAISPIGLKQALEDLGL